MARYCYEDIGECGRLAFDMLKKMNLKTLPGHDTNKRVPVSAGVTSTKLNYNATAINLCHQF